MLHDRFEKKKRWKFQSDSTALIVRPHHLHSCGNIIIMSVSQKRAQNSNSPETPPDWHSQDRDLKKKKHEKKKKQKKKKKKMG